jgi:hypothetical protein
MGRQLLLVSVAEKYTMDSAQKLLIEGEAMESADSPANRKEIVLPEVEGAGCGEFSLPKKEVQAIRVSPGSKRSSTEVDEMKEWFRRRK